MRTLANSAPRFAVGRRVGGVRCPVPGRARVLPLVTGPMSVEIHEIRNSAAWNEIVLCMPAADLEQGWEWGDIFTHTGWQIHRHAVTADGACVAAVAITSRHLAGLGAALYASRGPVIRAK